MIDDDDFKGASAPIPRMSMRVFPPALSVLQEQSLYETRGWTFQEELLSMRCLYLTEAQAYFRCPHGVLREDGADGFPDDSKSTELLSVVPLLFAGRSLSNAKKYDLHSLYASSLLEYTNRYFSLQEDVLNAFYGLQEVFAQSFGISFCCGLPESVFDYALLWRPASFLQRRGVPLPSWSWESWKGQIQQQWLEEAPQLGGASCITFNSAVRTFRVMEPSEMSNSETIKSGF